MRAARDAAPAVRVTIASMIRSDILIQRMDTGGTYTSRRENKISRPLVVVNEGASVSEAPGLMNMRRV